ncbi:MAG: 23S rRNA (uracil(1939)-C(5))-methyltransferase RlmD [Lachnospiraceae bacterium]|nr:23S rRNA (uracil(1939)-C(5))-methyltransferase RlmD [Lachnospiraceae bacterium]
MSKKKKQIDLSSYENREPLCPHFGVCGGCTYQKIAYETQLKMKAEKVRELLNPVYGSFEFEGILPSPSEEGYRNKMEFTFGDECKDGPFSLGLHQKGSFMNIVNITDCHLIHSDMNQIRNEARDFFDEYYEKGEVDFKNNKTHVGWLRHLLVRRAASSGEILVALVTASPSFSGVEKLKEGTFAEELVEGFKERLLGLKLEGTIAGILHITNDALSDVVKSDKTDILYGNDYINEEVLGLNFKISTFSFFQTNTKGAEVLYSKAREYASKSYGLLFDLYSGTGTIAQLMAPVVNKVIGVEIVAEAVEAAKENAALNGVENAEFVAADVLKALDDLPKPDSIILDPPREGINPKALGKILSYKVDNIVYVSCKPESLARDLQSFKIAGYDLVKACCVDMFPETEHVETVCLLSKKNS